MAPRPGSGRAARDDVDAAPPPTAAALGTGAAAGTDARTSAASGGEDTVSLRNDEGMSFDDCAGSGGRACACDGATLGCSVAVGAGIGGCGVLGRRGGRR